MTEEGSPLRLCCYIAYYAHFLEKSDDADADVIRAANDLPVEPRATGNSTFCTTVPTRLADAFKPGNVIPRLLC